MASVACSVRGCTTPAQSRGWCRPHYMQWWHSGKTQEPTGPIRAQRSQPEPCAVEGCHRSKRMGEMCAPHAKRAERNNGDPGRADIYAKVGQGKGGPKITPENYRLVIAPPDWPSAYKNGRILEHRFVMEKMLGRSLLPGENVHHVNGNRIDNRPENLELWSTRQPRGQRVRDKVAWAREILDLYSDLPDEVQ